MNNDKINELWAQSIKTVEIPMPNEIYKLGEGIFRRYETYDHIKFAELIVEECIKLNGKELAMAGHSRMVDVYCEHFGIEL